MGQVKSTCYTCQGSGLQWVDADKNGFPIKRTCGACAGRGYFTYWVNDPDKPTTKKLSFNFFKIISDRQNINAAKEVIRGLYVEGEYHKTLPAYLYILFPGEFLFRYYFGPLDKKIYLYLEKHRKYITHFITFFGSMIPVLLATNLIQNDILHQNMASDFSSIVFYTLVCAFLFYWIGEFIVDVIQSAVYFSIVLISLFVSIAIHLAFVSMGYWIYLKIFGGENLHWLDTIINNLFG